MNDATERASLELADTLDDSTLHRVFPNAPADTSMPTSKGALRKLRMQRLWAAQRTLFLSLLGIGAVVAIIGLAAGTVAVAVAVVVGALIVWGIIFAVQSSRATRDYMLRYAETRGLTFEGQSSVSGTVPLLELGDKRKYDRRLSGQIAGQEAALSHYTYTEVTRDSDGNRQETDHDYTVLEFPLPRPVAERYVAVYLSPKKLNLGALQDKLMHDRQVKLESIDFHKRYTLRVDDDQDEVALYELFNTTFIDQLATNLNITWEQVGASLVLYRKKHEFEAADLDRFCLEGWHVLQRYLEEYQ